MGSAGKVMIAVVFFLSAVGPARALGVDSTPPGSGAVVTAAPTEANSCNDGIDNDGDGLVDGADPDCREPGVSRCSDGIDNDRDGLVDLADPGCRSAADDSEFDLCADGIDNDGDGLMDAGDPDCAPGSGAGGEQNRPACDDGRDNDGDGLVDLADPGCRDQRDQSEQLGCSDGIDNDGDGRVDHPADPGCSSPEDDSEGGEPRGESCADGIDNDRDGLVDGADPDCHEPTPPAACSDGIDNDGDGKVDAEDPGCSSPDDNDETDPPAPDPCTAPAGDPGLLGNGTVAQQAYDSVLNQLPILEDPDANGPISGPVHAAGNGTPLEVLTDEGSCLLSLPAGDPL